MLLAVALGGVGVGGVGRQVAGAAPHETPARKIARLRSKAARVQAAIDRMNARVERLVEDYNEVREALARTRAEQARTREQVLDARRRLRAARRQLGKRLWTIYTRSASRPAWPPGAARSRPAWPSSGRYHHRLTRQVRRAVAEERRRQERI